MKLFFSTVIAEIKNAFVDAIDGPELIELLYRGVSDPLGSNWARFRREQPAKL